MSRKAKALPDGDQASLMQQAADRERNQPVAIPALAKDEQSAHQLFVGLQQHYIDALLADRLDKWAAAAHAIIDLLAERKVETREAKP